MLGNKLGFLVVSSSVVIDPDLEGRMEAPVVGLARLSCRPSVPQAGPQLHGIPPVSGLTGLTQKPTRTVLACRICRVPACVFTLNVTKQH